MIGGGTVAMVQPFAFKSAGIGLTLIFMLIILVFCDYTQKLLFRSSRIAGKAGRTYEDLGRVAFGERGVKVTQIVEVLNTFGVLIAYQVIIADQSDILKRWLSDDFILLRWHSKLFLLVAVVAVIMPVSMARTMKFLAIPSMLSLLAIGITGVAIIVRGIEHAGSATKSSQIPSCSVEFFKFETNLLLALPIVTLAFTSHINYLHTTDALKRPTPGRVALVSHTSMILSAVFYIAVGILGYSTFCDSTPSDILVGYSPSDDLIQVSRVLMIISFMFSYPLLCFPCRNAVTQILFKGKPFSWPRHISITLIIVVLTYLVAISVPNLGVVVGFIGSITATALSLTLPTAYYLKIADGPITSADKLPALAVLILGTSFGIAATAASIYNITQGNTE
ncbi:solute carrier family 38 member 5 [Thecamonas trahens ATCC 50062]|uniref:Solute carrier family 38 member 5 n=1 Tax=Thecamonas trahens ATCC 50062 TaxID=461836 RepID=A0A0L0DGB9_THETB|nr:solute carrier family 38 member 5 [Thecamonas trahens ATCC 50062]KNC51166.1 solute carrier family 38 member 5 [Thecamonas trahens ATCC 50062]|eukprot:XP_013756368.1 solute carrier family 38 member 5 [Thecamonas trahens ATCC 50062]